MNEKSYDLDTLFQTTEKDVKKKIETSISDKEIISILKGGKYLHSFLAALSFKVCTCGKETSSKYQRALEGAVLIEIACTASFVHQFIIKMEKERRGKPPYYIQEVINSAILNGHKLLIYGINIALSHGDDITRLIINTWDDILTGELLDINFNKKDLKNMSDEISVKSKYFNKYDEIINMKTASLFSSACKAGAIEGDQSGEILEVFADYGREIGLACQLADDIIELKTGKRSIGVAFFLLSRLKKKTINNIYPRRRLIKKKLNKRASKIQQLYIEEIIKHVRKAEKLGKSEIIPSSSYKNMLQDAPAYIINKMLKEISISI
jgi:geranylgeranyl pyrophosphate synthase